jgi:hypothetical protein
MFTQELDEAAIFEEMRGRGREGLKSNPHNDMDKVSPL